MRTIKLSKKLSEEQMESVMGKFLEETTSYDLLIQEDTDAFDAETGKPLFKFRKSVIPPKIAAAAFYSARTAANPTYNRGTASGSTLEPYRIKKNGKRSRTTKTSEAVLSGIVGYYDRYVRTPYCRTTAWTQEHMGRFRKLHLLIKFVSDQYRELMPEEYALQKAMAEKTSPDFVIKDTVFTTVTVNKNYQTSVHTDKGDYSKGFGNLTVLRAGQYTGGYFVLPQYRVAIDMQNLDLLFVDVHQPHGNTPIHLKGNAERISLVMYYRENMIYCGTKQQELELAKSFNADNPINTKINLNKNHND